MSDASHDTDHSPTKPLTLRRDVFAGMMFVAFGCWGIAAGYDLDAGTLSEMGPAYFPRVVSCLLIILGLAITAGGFSKNAELIELPWGLRPIAMITIASLAFAFLLERGGIVLAIFATVFIGALAGERPRWITLVSVAVSLMLVCTALFVWALGMQIPIWPHIPRL